MQLFLFAKNYSFERKIKTLGAYYRGNMNVQKMSHLGHR